MKNILISSLCVSAALAASGCAGFLGSDSRLTSTSGSLEAPEFTPPNDPAMGRVAVAVPQVTVSAPKGLGIGDLGQTVRSQLTSTLASSPNFLVADRDGLNDLAEEHRLADSGAISSTDLPRPGSFVGARYLIRVNVTELQENVVGKSGGGGFRIGQLFGVLSNFVGGSDFQAASETVQCADPTVGAASETIEGLVGMEVQIVDVDTSAVVATTRAQGKLRHENSRAVLGIAGVTTSSGSFANSVLAHATRAAAESATVKIHAALRQLEASPRGTSVIGLASSVR